MLRDSEGNFFSDDTTVGTMLTEHWRKVFNTPTNKRSDAWSTMDTHIPPIQWSTLENPTSEDITTILQYTGHSVPGLDGVSYDLLRTIPLTHQLLSQCFIQWRQGFPLPEEWNRTRL
eukprot:7149528-Prorocentrum_lima.AAC.1